MSADANTITQLYEQIPLEAMQQVADSYMTWYVDKVTHQLDETIAKLRAELEENDKQEALFKPSAAELDAMRRLQANKVSDVDLLDRLVGKGEEWLVLTMHRLDYFERAGLAPTDYPGWCEHALIGAYDWIDAPRLHASKRMFSLQGGGTGPMRAIRPSDLAAAASKKEPSAQPRAESAPPARPAPAPQRAEPPAPKPPAPAPRAHEPTELSTQPVPSIAQPAPAVHAPAAQEQIGKLETAPLPPSAARPEAPPRQAAPAAQAPQRAPVASGNIPDAPTRPTPTAVPTPKTAPPQQPAPGGQLAGGAGAPPAAQRRTEPPPQQPRPQPPMPPQAPRPQQTAVPPSQAQQPYAAAPKPRPSGAPPTWGGQEQPRSDPRYSLDDVEVEDLEEEGEDQGLIRKIFRVFTG
jgi:hypothetical protein